jgi:hypothetical protein
MPFAIPSGAAGALQDGPESPDAGQYGLDFTTVNKLRCRGPGGERAQEDAEQTMDESRLRARACLRSTIC